MVNSVLDLKGQLIDWQMLATTSAAQTSLAPQCYSQIADWIAEHAPHVLNVLLAPLEYLLSPTGFFHVTWRHIDLTITPQGEMRLLSHLAPEVATYTFTHQVTESARQLTVALEQLLIDDAHSRYSAR